MTRYLLDTNIAIAVLEGQIDLTARFATGLQAFLNATILAELYFGAEKSSQVGANRRDTLRRQCQLLISCAAAAAPRR